MKVQKSQSTEKLIIKEFDFLILRKRKFIMVLRERRNIIKVIRQNYEALDKMYSIEFTNGQKVKWAHATYGQLMDENEALVYKETRPR